MAPKPPVKDFHQVYPWHPTAIPETIGAQLQAIQNHAEGQPPPASNIDISKHKSQKRKKKKNHI